MKKKLLLIPIALMSSFIVGCRYKAVTVHIGEWFNNNAYEYSKPSFDIVLPDEEVIGSIDYDKEVQRIVSGKLRDVELVGENIKESKKERTDTYLSYAFHCHVRQMGNCLVHIYDNGYITTYASANSYDLFGLMTPKDQDVSYRISEDAAKEIIEKAKERYLEIKEVQDREEAELKEYAKLENIFKRAEETTKELKVWCKVDRPDVTPSIFTDENLEYLDALKQVEYEETTSEWFHYRYRMNAVTYNLDNDFNLGIQGNYDDTDNVIYDAVRVTLYYDLTYPKEKEIVFFYKIDPTVGKQLVDKANQMRVDYFQTH